MNNVHNMMKFIRGTAGVAAVWFGMTVPLIVTSVGMSVDLAQSYLVRERLTHALDAAALAATASGSADDTFLEDKVNDFVDANYPDDVIGYRLDVEVDNSDETLFVSATARLDTSFMKIFGMETVDVAVESEVTRIIGSNIELALVLDISNSMNSLNKINDLKDAAESLVDIVVYENQEDYYSKVAIVPYGVAVNVGAYADSVRGAITQPKTITGATRANPVVITSAAHGFVNGQRVYINGVSGMTQINNRSFVVAGRTANTFQLSGINGTSYSTFTGTAQAHCTTAGCSYYYFQSPSGNWNTFPSSTCVSERTGANAYTDVPPSTTLVGRNYASPTNNPCLASQITPLTSDRDTLFARINALAASGSTGGQVGVGWGWYMLAPDWGYLWADDESEPADYGTADLHKIVVLMTDGEYNSPYCNGVIAADATTGSGATADHINCNATNGGTSYTQAEAMCDAMKDDGKEIEIYTIGFRVDAYPRGEQLMEYCASDASHFFTADNGEELQEAFEQIARNVKSMYLSN